MPFTAAGASLVAVGLLRVSRLQTKNRGGGVLGGFRDLCPLPFQAQGARARTGTLRRALEDEGKLGKAMAEGKLEKAMDACSPLASLCWAGHTCPTYRANVWAG